MAKGFTYRAKDSRFPIVHTRYSAGHAEAKYVAAVIAYPKNGSRPRKHQVSFCSREDLAVQKASAMHKLGYETWTAPVEAIPGRAA